MRIHSLEPFRTCLLIVLPLLVLPFFVPSPFASESGRMVVLVSIDGFASYYLDDPMADIPTIRRLAEEGVRAKRMNVCFPSVTWVSHTTLIAGVYPQKHGMVGNSFLDRDTLKEMRFVGDAEFTKDEAVKSPTLYDAAYAAGLKTAAVIWPAVRGAKTLHWLTPDVNSEELILRDTTPELNRDLGAPIGNPIATISQWRWGTEPGPYRDGKYSELAAWLLTEKQPDLLLLHLICPDAFSHTYGPQSPVAYWSLNYIEIRIQYIINKLEDAGLLDRVSLFIVSDHGFESIEHQLYPNVLLKQNGLANFDGETLQPGSEAYVLSHGGSASVYLLNSSRKEEVKSRVVSLFSKLDGVQQILEPDEFQRLGLPSPNENPRQGDLMLIPKDHYAFSSKVGGNEVVVHGGYTGTHGHLPSHPRMGALFTAWGNGIRKGVRLDSIESVDVAPTLAELLGISMQNTDGKIRREILE